MSKMIDIQVTDQFSQVIAAKALLRCLADEQNRSTELVKEIDHIVVNGEKILPSIELLFESQESANIYRVVED